jgi:hypothetical protein
MHCRVADRSIPLWFGSVDRLTAIALKGTLESTVGMNVLCECIMTSTTLLAATGSVLENRVLAGRHTCTKEKFLDRPAITQQRSQGV